MAGEITVFRLHIAIEFIAPPIWREIEVTSNTTLTGLHDVLQALMGWHDSHLWAFEAGDRRFEAPDPDSRTKPAANADPQQVTLATLLAGKGASLRYNYDFGDDWCIKIKVVAVDKLQPKARYPHCVAGERAGPPEDCGGARGFEELLKARKNPQRRDAKQLLEWAGPDWNPDAFDLALVNKSLSALPAPRRLH